VAALRAQVAAERAQRSIELDAARSLRVSAAARVRQGITGSAAELTAAEAWIEQRDALLQLEAAALSADIDLQRALGGGYEAAKESPRELANTHAASMTATP
jgi:outer membrane protein TolC